MLVSVITPSLNQGKFIGDTIESVRRQRHPQVEHIVVDGGSTDSTIDVLKRSSHYPHLWWISEPDGGQADAVNKGLALAHGDVIGWLNSDDVYFDRQSISIAVRTFAENPKIDVVYGDIARISHDNRLLRIEVVPDFSYPRLLQGCFIKQPAVFMRRIAVNGLKLDTALECAMDYELWLRLGQHHRFLHVRRILAADRTHANRKMVVDYERMVRETEELRRRFGAGSTLPRSMMLWRLVMSAIPRRLIGLYRLTLLEHAEEWAFEVKRGNRFLELKRQLFMTSDKGERAMTHR